MLKFFVLITLLEIKHFLADWVLQTDVIAYNKGENLKLLLIHSLHHAILTFTILLFFSNIKLTFLIAITEIIIHSLIDFIKANKNLLGKYQFPAKEYFIFLGLDQLLHKLTYLIIVFIVL